MAEPDDILNAARSTVPNTLASWLDEVAIHIDCVASREIMLEAHRVSEFPYRDAAGKITDLCRVAVAFAKLYPDPIKADSLSVLAGVLNTVTPIMQGDAEELWKLTGGEGWESALAPLREADERYAAPLRDIADRARGHDLEHGPVYLVESMPKGDLSAEQTADAVELDSTKRKPKTRQGRPATADPEADRKLAERWKSMKVEGVATYAEAAKIIGISEHILRAAVERHRKRND